MVPLVYAALALLLAPLASAGLTGGKTMQQPWPERQVDANWVLPKGWFQLGLSFDHKRTGYYRDDYGLRQPWDDASWRYSRAWLRIDQGFSKHVRLSLNVPFVQARLVNGLGADTSTRALGDVETSVTVQPWLEGPLRPGFRVMLKSPSGLEWPADLVGGAASTSGFLTGTGTTDLTGEALLRWRAAGRLAVDARLAGTITFPGVVGYVVESDGFANGWLNPGDEVALKLGATGQLTEDVALSGWARGAYRSIFTYGVSGEGVARLDMYYLPGPEGLWVDVGGEAAWNVGDHAAVRAGVAWQAAGGDTRPLGALGLEAWSPQPGLTSSAALEVRW